MERKLKSLIKQIPQLQVKGSKEITLRGLSSDSRKIGPKDLFLVRKGKEQDGNEFIASALQNGAVAIANEVYNPLLKGITQLIYPDIQELEALLAARFYQDPSQKLDLIGITGTNGKTTTSYLIRAFLSRKRSCGLIGTVEYAFAGHHFPSNFTTPDITTLQKLLDQMVRAGCKAAAMEVSSHALDQRRVEGLYFKAAVLTNLTPEHLDYHGDMNQYTQAKEKLFTNLSSSSFAILNQDAAFSLSGKTCGQIVSYGIENHSDYLAEEIKLYADYTEFVLVHKSQKRKVVSPLIGVFNIYNLLAAIATVHLLGLSWEEIMDIVPKLEAAPGRLQKIKNKRKISIFVDYAHTEDALQKVLSTLFFLKKNRLITIFGCGGNRDPYKRPKMAQVAEKYSDLVIVTSDNPRNEDPESIAQQIEKGFSFSSYIRLLDRRQAIEKALHLAQAGDIILIAGKGHEKVQVLGSCSFPFDDVKVVQDILQKKD